MDWTILNATTLYRVNYNISSLKSLSVNRKTLLCVGIVVSGVYVASKDTNLS